MRVERKIMIDVCDICGLQFNGQVHPFFNKAGQQVGEICSGCWAPPTDDMRAYATQIIEGCHQNGVSLRQILSGFAVLCGDRNGAGITTAKNLEEAKEIAVEATMHDDKLIDLFDHGRRMYASVIVEVRFGAPKPGEQAK